MKASEAIEQADALRPNTISDDQKILWLYELEADLSELMMIWDRKIFIQWITMTIVQRT